VKVIEHLEGRYETQEVPFGTVYRWCPGCIVVECDCGEGLTLNASRSTCSECGSDHTSVVREELSPRRLGEENLHPWRYHQPSSKDSVMPF
jgi:hypothetical protein